MLLERQSLHRETLIEERAVDFPLTLTLNYCNHDNKGLLTLTK